MTSQKEPVETTPMMFQIKLEAEEEAPLSEVKEESSFKVEVLYKIATATSFVEMNL